MKIGRSSTTVAFLAAALILTALLPGLWSQNASAQPVAATSPFIVEYPLPAGYDSPRSITVEAPGHVWFTLPQANAIGSLVVNSPSDYDFQQYTAITADSEPYDLVYHDGYVWFTEHSGNRIGRLDVTTNIITEYPLPDAGSGPAGIDVDASGMIWFVEQNQSRIARLDPASGDIEEFDYTAQGAEPVDLSVGNDAVWFTVPNLNRTVRYRPSTDSFTTVPVLDFGVVPFPPGDIVIDGNNMPWITAPTKDLVGRYAPGTLAYWRWNSLRSGGYPTGIAYAQLDGMNTIWFTETNGNRVGYVASSSSSGVRFVNESALPTANSQPRDIAVDGEGQAWITEMGANKIAQWSPPYFYYNNLPLITTQ